MNEYVEIFETLQYMTGSAVESTAMLALGHWELLHQNLFLNLHYVT